jgi:hypothetical protein
MSCARKETTRGRARTVKQDETAARQLHDGLFDTEWQKPRNECEMLAARAPSSRGRWSVHKEQRERAGKRQRFQMRAVQCTDLAPGWPARAAGPASPQRAARRRTPRKRPRPSRERAADGAQHRVSSGNKKHRRQRHCAAADGACKHAIKRRQHIEGLQGTTRHQKEGKSRVPGGIRTHARRTLPSLAYSRATTPSSAATHASRCAAEGRAADSEQPQAWKENQQAAAGSLRRALNRVRLRHKGSERSETRTQQGRGKEEARATAEAALDCT